MAGCGLPIGGVGWVLVGEENRGQRVGPQMAG